MVKKYDYTFVLEELYKLGLKNGTLTSTQISEAIGEREIDPERLDEFYKRCSKDNIKIIDKNTINLDIEKLDESEISRTSWGSDRQYIDSLKAYLVEIRNIPLLSAEEEIELARAIKEGSEKEAKRARKKLIESNLKLVVSIAKKYAIKYNEPLLDVAQDGNLGLMTAIEKFDYKMGFRFSTYATYWIRQSISRRYAFNGRAIRIPVNKQGRIAKIKKAVMQLISVNEKKPSEEEIAEYLNLPVKEVKELILCSQDVISLETPVGEEDDGAYLKDFIPDSDESFNPVQLISDDFSKAEEAREILNNSQEYLSESEIDVIKKRFGFEGKPPATLDQIAAERHCTRERVRQIEAKALKKLRMFNRHRKNNS